MLNWLGVAIGVAGVISVVPALKDLALGFGLLEIVWFAWLGCLHAAHEGTFSGGNMNSLERKAGPAIKEKVSLLWIVVMLNMVFADILTFITPGSLQEMMTGYAGELKITQGLLLVFAFLIEIPIIMILLSRDLNRKINRIANVAACVVTIAFVIGGGSRTAHYVFFAGIEVACMLLIVWKCIRWPKENSVG